MLPTLRSASSSIPLLLLQTGAAASPFDSFAASLSATQRRICEALEEQEGGVRFGVQDWQRPGGGWGSTRVLEGGGICESNDDCAGRAQGDLGSSKDYAPTIYPGRGMLEFNESTNPDFSSWNRVFVPYCSGECSPSFGAPCAGASP